jgi:predicted MFS family arabinose efflux permease
VVSIALGSFALVFSEVIPVGLLGNISGHLGVSIGTGGLMVVVPAVAAAVAAPLLTLRSARLERCTVLVGLSALVLVSDVIAYLAPGIEVMLAARAVLGVCVGGFWVFGAGAAITLVSEQARGTAVAVVSSGIFIATVVSVPTASLIGTLTTWRVAFAVAAVFAVIALAAQLAAVPRLGPGGPVRPRSLLTGVTRPVSRIGLVAAGSSSPTSPPTPTSDRCCTPGPTWMPGRSRWCCSGSAWPARPATSPLASPCALTCGPR